MVRTVDLGGRMAAIMEIEASMGILAFSPRGRFPLDDRLRHLLQVSTPD